MNPELKAIAKLVPPPETPNGLDRPWQIVEQEIGLKLPTDYKRFIDLYGSGYISGNIFVLNFRDTSLYTKSLSESLCGERSFIQDYEHVRAMAGYEWPYKMYPNRGGLLPFGVLFEIDTFNWLTRGRPNEWDIVYWQSDGQEFVHLAGDSFSQCLLKLLKRKYTHMQLPKFDPPYTFEKWSSPAK